MNHFLQQAAEPEAISEINSKIDIICKDESKDRTIRFLQQSKIKKECDLEETDSSPRQVNYTTSQYYNVKYEPGSDPYNKFEEIGKNELKESSLFVDLKELNCGPCNKNYETKTKLKDHIQYAHGRTAQCKECGEVCQSKKKLQQHTWKRHEKLKISKTDICEKCGTGFYAAWRLKRHMESCDKSKIKKIGITFSDHRCEPCQRYFASDGGLKNHMNTRHQAIAHKNMIHKCNLCSQVYKRRFALLKHSNLHKVQIRPGEEKILPALYCTVCGLTFGSKLALGRHLNKDHPNMKFPCNICRKLLPNKKSLIGHKKRVHGDRVKCLKCGQSYGNKYNLESHQRKNCVSFKIRLWEDLGRKGRRQRMKVIIDALSGVLDRWLDDRHLLCMQQSLLAMSNEERKKIQNEITDNFHTICEAMGKQILTVEDVTKFIDEQLRKTKTLPFDAECQYCGEEFMAISALEKHIQIFHASQYK